MKYFSSDGKVLIILLYSFLSEAQKIIIENKNTLPVQVQYLHKNFELGVRQKKIIDEKTRVKMLSVSSAISDKKNTSVSLFLYPGEMLSILLKKDSIVFKGDRDALHNYVFRHLMTDLSMKIFDYQKYDGRNDPAGFIRISEAALEEVLNRVEHPNHSSEGRNSICFKEIEKRARDHRFFTLFVCINSAALDHTGKELMLYYYDRYFKKDIAGYTCNSGTDYDILRKYSVNRKLLKLQLPVYEIIEHTDDDGINRYLPAECQEFYFRESYHFLIHRRDIRAERYKKILAEKFHITL